MAYPQGINFRASAGYVTDVSPATSEVSANADYPRTTPQGNTVGWEAPGPGNSRDRTTANDARLAGCHFNVNSGTAFRFDLPAPGSYNVRAAFGDPSSSGNATAWSLLDTAAVLATLSTGTQATANTFRDATNALRTAAAWPSSNAALPATFASTICRIRSDSTAANMVSHIYIEAAVPAGASGVLVATLAGASLSASGAVVASGTFQSTLAGASLAASGLVASPPSGALASTLAGAAMSANGSVTNVGALAASLDGATMSAAGTVTNRGAIASQLDGASMAASGSVITVPTGTLSSTLDGASLTAGGYVGTPPAAPDFFLRLPKNPRHVIHHH